MKTEIKAITPTQAGLSLVVCSGPRGAVRDNDWPCIQYTIQVVNDRRTPIWTGEYHLGIGHVKNLTSDQVNRGNIYRYGLTREEERIAEIYASGRRCAKNPETQKNEASLAAKLAKLQKATPKLDDVAHSLLSDGSAFFDGQRFEDWAGDLGYDSDSIKAKETFETCDRIGRGLSRHLSRDQIDGLREWASNY